MDMNCIIKQDIRHWKMEEMLFGNFFNYQINLYV